MQNSDLYKFGIKKFQSSDVCSSTLQKSCAGGACSLMAVKIMISILDIQFYVPIKLCKTEGSIHLFKIMGMLNPENVKVN